MNFQRIFSQYITILVLLSSPSSSSSELLSFWTTFSHSDICKATECLRPSKSLGLITSLTLLLRAVLIYMYLYLWGASCCVIYTYTFQVHLRSQLRIYWCYIFLSVHNMLRPLRAIFKWYTITSLTYLEKAIGITTDPLFHNFSLIIHFTIQTMAK
jgi:hypothetical protein